MKRIYIVLISLCVFGMSAYAQEPALAITDLEFDRTYSKRPNPVINGQIINATADELKQITLEFTLVRPREPVQTKLGAEISSDGTFQLQLPNKLPYQQIWFSLGEYVYSCLYANAELNLTFDLKKLKSKKVYMLGEGMEFSGEDGEINRTLNAYIMYKKKHLPDLYNDLQKLEMKDTRYMEKLDLLFNLQRRVDANFLKENKQIAKKIIESETEAYYNSKRINYLLYQQDELANVKELEVPIYAITNESGEYLRFLHRYVNNKKLHTKEERVNNRIKFSKIDSLFPNAYADLIKLQVASSDLPEQLKINTDLANFQKTEWIALYLADENRELTEKINRMQELLSAKGDSSKSSKIGKYLKSTRFQASMYLNEAKSGDELLKSIKVSFPGKYIIIDLWATWCMPCLANMPHSKDLQHQSEKEKLPVVFVYLCTDGQSSETVWQNKIAELGQPGEHVFVQNNQMNELLTLFNGSGYPTYVIINPKGEADTQTINLNRRIDLDGLKKLIME